MEASLVLGGTLDIATPGEVKGIVDTGIDRLMGGKVRKNFVRPIASHNVTPAATGTFAMDLGSPNAGLQWNLSEVLVTGATDREAPAGAVAALYMGSPPYMPTPTTVIGTPSLGQLLRPALALPAVFVFGGHEPVVVKDGWHLIVIIYSPTTAMTVMSAVASVSEIRASAVAMNMLP